LKASNLVQRALPKSHIQFVSGLCQVFEKNCTVHKKICGETGQKFIMQIDAEAYPVLTPGLAAVGRREPKTNSNCSFTLF